MITEIQTTTFNQEISEAAKTRETKITAPEGTKYLGD